MLRPDAPTIIALCGHPYAGKSEAQKILEELFAAQSIDDGWPMRDFAVRHLGLSIADVTTQEGKARIFEFAGKSMKVREFLGEFGNRIEDLMGPDAIPLMAARKMLPGVLYCAGSVRREQGRVWKAQGAVVVQINNPMAAPSEFAFDRFNEDLVDVVIENDALAWGHHKAVARRDLETKLIAMMDKHLGLKPLRVLRQAA